MPKKTILISGPSGFIGGHLIVALRKSDFFDVIALTSKKIHGHKCIIHNGYNYNVDEFEKISVKKIDYVIHAGSFTPKSKDQANDIDKTLANIRSTKKILDELPNIPEKILFLSTLDVYGNKDEIIDENTIVEPSNQYAYSKLYCETLITEWAKQNNVIHQILRIGHIYGPGEEVYTKFIPEVMKCLVSDQKVKLFTSGTEKRSYLYIEDCIKFIIKSLELESFAGPINIVSDKAYSIIDILKLIFKISDRVSTDFDVDSDKLGNDSIFNASKRIMLLGNEEMDLELGLSNEYNHILNIN